MFHVEQPPVQVAATTLAAAINQCVAAGFEGDHGQGFAQLPELAHILPIQPRFPTAASVAEAGTMRRPGHLPLRIGAQRGFSLPDQAVAYPPPEAAAMRQQM